MLLILHVTPNAHILFLVKGMFVYILMANGLHKLRATVLKVMFVMVKEDMEFMGPVRMKDVEEAQQKIVNIIRKLEDSGEIIISRGGGDEIVV